MKSVSTSKARGRIRRGLGLIALMATLGVAPFAARSDAEPNETADPAGNATAVGMFAGYSDEDTFFRGSSTEPPNTFVPYATSGFDNTGSGLGQAAVAFNPYFDAPGAINGVAPPGTPQVPAGDLRANSRAQVSGQPPQDNSITVTPDGSPAIAGSARATLEEDGPAAVAKATAIDGTLADQVRARVAQSTTRVVLQGGKAVSTAATVIEDILISDVLVIGSVVLEATSTADGAEGPAAATVKVSDVTVSGTKVELTDQGVVVAGQTAPVAAGQVSQALAQAGVELVTPGGRTTQPGPKASTAEARGPSIRLRSAQGHQVEITFGVVTTSSIQVGEAAPALNVSLPDASPASESSLLPDSYPAAEPSLSPAPPSSELDTNWLSSSTPVSSELLASAEGSNALGGSEPQGVPVPVEGSSPSDSSLEAVPAAVPRTTGEAKPLAAEMLRLSRLLYGALALTGAGLFLAGLVAPRGEAWLVED